MGINYILQALNEVGAVIFLCAPNQHRRKKTNKATRLMDVENGAGS